MTDQELRARIVSDPKVMVGQPCIRGTRLTVRFIVNLLAHGTTIDEILTEYYRLTHEDVLACLLHAADMLGRQSSIDVVELDAFVAIVGSSDRGNQDA